ncbi:MAG TPA: response regulator [Woeseiaceae bacterium]|nr:response regulator [Woeseiaceae bacterium]
MNSRGARILLIEDEAHIRNFLRVSLQAHGYDVIEARAGDEGLVQAGDHDPQLVILDLGLPDMDGQDVIRRLRGWSDVPILVLSVRGHEAEKVTALDNGANDYVEKPAGISELMARVRVLLRRPDGDSAAAANFRRGELSIDLARRAVALAGEPVHLTPKEYDLLCLLVRSNGRVLTHQQALRELWGPAFTGHTHYLRILVSAVRQKLGDDPTDPQFIVTEQGVGYRLP